MTDQTAAQLIRELKVLNRALSRAGLEPLVTVEEAEDLSLVTLGHVVSGTSNHLADVTEQLRRLR